MLVAAADDGGAVLGELLPGLGFAADLADVAARLATGLRLTFGGGPPSLLAVLFLTFYAVACFGQAMLIRHCDGSTWSALVNGLVTPVGACFWTLFREHDFAWDPQIRPTTLFSLVGVLLIVPGLLHYNLATKHAKRGAESLSEMEQRFV